MLFVPRHSDLPNHFNSKNLKRRVQRNFFKRGDPTAYSGKFVLEITEILKSAGVRNPWTPFNTCRQGMTSLWWYRYESAHCDAWPLGVIPTRNGLSPHVVDPLVMNTNKHWTVVKWNGKMVQLNVVYKVKGHCSCSFPIKTTDDAHKEAPCRNMALPYQGLGQTPITR